MGSSLFLSLLNSIKEIESGLNFFFLVASLAKVGTLEEKRQDPDQQSQISFES